MSNNQKTGVFLIVQHSTGRDESWDMGIKEKLRREIVHPGCRLST